MISIAAGKVTLEKEGKKFTVPLSTLVDQDVVYLKNWYHWYLKRNQTYSVRISVFPKKGESPAKIKRGFRGKSHPRPTQPFAGNVIFEGTTSVEKEHFQISLTNNSAVPLDRPEIKYCVYLSESSRGFGGSKKRDYRLEGSIEAGKLGAKETLKTNTATIVLENRTSTTMLHTSRTRQLGGGRTSIDETQETRGTRKRPQITGIWVKLYNNGLFVKEYKKLNPALEHQKVGFGSSQSLPTVRVHSPGLTKLQ